MNKGVQFGVFSFLFVFAIVCVVLSATLYHTQWGLFVLLPYFFLPLTAFGCASFVGNDEMSVYVHFGFFLEAFFWVSAYAIPLVLKHIDAINGSQLGWLLAADVMVLVCFVGLSWINYEDGYSAV